MICWEPHCLCQMQDASGCRHPPDSVGRTHLANVILSIIFPVILEVYGTAEGVAHLSFNDCDEFRHKRITLFLITTPTFVFALEVGEIPHV